MIVNFSPSSLNPHHVDFHGPCWFGKGDDPPRWKWGVARQSFFMLIFRFDPLTYVNVARPQSPAKDSKSQIECRWRSVSRPPTIERSRM